MATVIVFVKCDKCAMTFRDSFDLKRHGIAHEAN
jgi:uncharacterized C2H2 Zn-finger protein